MVTIVVDTLLLPISEGSVNSFKHFLLYVAYLIGNIVLQSF